MFVIFKIFVGGRNYRTQLEGFLEVIETGKFERKQEAGGGSPSVGKE
jgi:hypothetical protein